VSGWTLTPAALGPAVVPAAAWVAARLRLRSRGTRWPAGRDAAAVAALGCVLVATASPLAAHDEDFPVHVVQHLLLGMVAPLGVALSAPVTLLLRAGGVRTRRRLLAVLRSRAVRVLGWAPTGLLLSVGLMWPLYLTPLYAATLHRPLLHAAVHLHALLAGTLLAVALAGPDPVPGRGGLGVRVATLAAAVVAHEVLARYLYVHAGELAGGGTGSPADWRLGAQLLWYGGDAADVLLAVAFFGRWYAAAGRRLRHERRRLAARAG
jgi:putative membrane protein